VCEFQIYSCFDYLKYVLDIAWDLILYADTLKMVCHLSEIHTYLDILYFLFTVVLYLNLVNLVAVQITSLTCDYF
jgi:hypothetical protein